MLGKKKFKPKMYYFISLNRLVPEDDFYRKVEAILDLGFTRQLCKNLYGKTGNKSIDPVVFFKIELYGYLEGITSDRALARRIRDSLSLRLFLYYDLDEETPCHSTISRTRRLIPQEVYEKVFDYMLSLCIEAGLVLGKHQSIDSTLVEANASIDSMEKKRPQLTVVEHYEKAIVENADEKHEI